MWGQWSVQHNDHIPRVDTKQIYFDINIIYIFIFFFLRKKQIVLSINWSKNCDKFIQEKAKKVVIYAYA